jgi:16S rRNA (cytosine1402-N4)-methyltransferase
MAYHIPVMLKEAIDALAVIPGGHYIDGTAGGGGHTEVMLQAGGRVLAIDQDSDAIAEVRQRLRPYIEEGRLTVMRGNFRDIASITASDVDGTINGILLDLGVSSHQLDETARGFSFQSDTLDMRMDSDLSVDAAAVVATLPERDLTTLFAEIGEERLASRFARAIVRERGVEPITSAKRLAEIIKQASPPAYRFGRIHPATRVFQAVRIAVNDELHALEAVLPEAYARLTPGGRLVVISFHSLEDRIIKRFFASLAQQGARAWGPIAPSDEEVAGNSRSRSAKMRVVEKPL